MTNASRRDLQNTDWLVVPVTLPDGHVALALGTVAVDETTGIVDTRPLTTGAATKDALLTPAVTASAYSAGQCIGGLLTFPNFARATGLGGTLQLARIMTKTAQSFAADWVFFNDNPTASTLTDHATAAIAAADMSKIFAGYSAVAGNWIAGNPASICTLGQLATPYTLVGTSLYAALISRGTPTLGSTSDLVAALSAYLD